MKILFTLLFLVQALSGCAVYTGVSTVTLITTEGSLTDHAVTLITPNGNCSSLNLVKGHYYCEIRDVSQTYNRNTY